MSTRKLKPLLIQQAAEDGFEVRDFDFINILHHPFNLSQNFFTGLMVFTSKNAVSGLVQNSWWNHQAGRVACLSGETLEAVKSHTSLTVVLTAGNATELATAIAALPELHRVCFFCGNLRLPHLPRILQDHGIEVEEIITYSTLPTPVKIDVDYKGLMFFSPSAVESFFGMNRPAPEVPCFCIGATTGASVRQHAANEVVISPHPSQHHLLETIKEYYRKRN